MNLEVMSEEIKNTERFKARTEEQIKTLFTMRAEFRDEMQTRMLKIEGFQKVEIAMLILTVIGMFLNIIVV